MSEADENQTVSVKITPSLDAEIERVRRQDRTPPPPKGFFIDVLLRYALTRSGAAFDEWNGRKDGARDTTISGDAPTG